MARGALLALFALHALAAALPARAAAPGPVQRALEGSLAMPGARLEILELHPSLPPACAVDRADAPRPVAGSGRTPVHLSGRDRSGAPCEGWAWARVRVSAKVLVTRRALREGEELGDAALLSEREIASGRTPLVELAAGAVAAHPLGAGVALEAAHVRTGPRPGDALTVVLRIGNLRAEQAGRAVPCPRGRACALLPSGRRVEGTWTAGQLRVETP